MTSRRKSTPKSKAKTKAKATTSKAKTQRAKPAPRADAMTPEVMEFIGAIDHYKRENQRPFPTWSEVLDILKNLGYSRV